MISFSLANMLLFACAVVGMTGIIVDSDMPLVSWIRNVGNKCLSYIPGNWSKIFGCYQCCGTWCGFFCGFFLLSHNPWVVFLSGCAGSFIAPMGAKYITYLDAVSLISLLDKDNKNE